MRSSGQERVAMFLAAVVLGLIATGCGAGSEDGEAGESELRKIVLADFARYEKAQQLCRWGYDMRRMHAEHAADWKKAEAAGMPEAALLLGVSHQMGIGGPKDRDAAFAKYCKAAAAGVPLAMVEVARCASGSPGRVTRKEANELLMTAAKKRCSAAFHLLGEAYEFGDGVEKDLAKAAEYFRLADAAGNSNGKIGLSYVASDEGRHAESLKIMEEAAQAGNRLAMLLLGKNYAANGWVLSHNSDATNSERAEAKDALSKAVQWYTKAVEWECAESAYRLAWLHRDGILGKVDLDAEEKLLKKAAEWDYGPAQARLGALYVFEKAVGADQAEVLRLLYAGARADEGVAFEALKIKIFNPSTSEEKAKQHMDFVESLAEKGQKVAREKFQSVFIEYILKVNSTAPGVLEMQNKRFATASKLWHAERGTWSDPNVIYKGGGQAYRQISPGVWKLEGGHSPISQAKADKLRNDLSEQYEKENRDMALPLMTAEQKAKFDKYEPPPATTQRAR